MRLTIPVDPTPVALDTDGVARVGGTRVTLDTIIIAYKLGATAEEIALRYDSLNLADIYSALAYYLRHRPEVDAYLDMRRLEGAELRRFNESRIDREGIRDRLLTRAAHRRTP